MVSYFISENGKPVTKRTLPHDLPIEYEVVDVLETSYDTSIPIGQWSKEGKNHVIGAGPLKRTHSMPMICVHDLGSLLFHYPTLRVYATWSAHGLKANIIRVELMP